MEEYQRKLMSIGRKYKKLHAMHLLKEITFQEYSIMMTIRYIGRENHEQVKVSAIASKLDVVLSGVSRTVRDLEGKGYVERCTDEKDRRNTYVRMTEMGRKRLDESEEIISTVFRNISDRIGEEKLNQFCEILEEIQKTAADEIERYCREEQRKE